MSRYRLRFLLQEFDLPTGVTVVGRSLECNLTIEDPLVSRQHARITIDDSGARVEDLGSRNGVKVNSAPIKSATPLKDGDRLRIGTQDFVFCRVDPAGRAHSKTTGSLRLCANCRLPYPREMLACPNCEATEQTDEETLSGSFGSQSQTAWSVQLLVEALQRALALGRVTDADRIVRRASQQIEELLASQGALDSKALAALAIGAVKSSIAANDPTWGLWVFDVYRRANRVPPADVVDHLAELASRYPIPASAPLRELLQHFSKVTPGEASDIDSITRLEQMRRVVEQSGEPAALDPTETTGEWPQPS